MHNATKVIFGTCATVTIMSMLHVYYLYWAELSIEVGSGLEEPVWSWLDQNARFQQASRLHTG
jgi:hypothetical protein